MDAASLTQALYNAFCTNKPLDMKACSGVLNDYESAYAVQRKFAELKGEPTGGYKISLTSKTTQDMFGTTEPLFGEQTKSHIFAAPCTLELDHMNEPLIEVELSMIPKVDLTSSMSDEELLENITVAAALKFRTLALKLGSRRSTNTWWLPTRRRRLHHSRHAR